MRWIAPVVLAAACGRAHFDPAGDAMADAIADVAPTTYRDAVLADAPVGYWRLGDAGTTARDETGHYDGAYLGTCTPGVTGALAADPDTAVTFDGTTCDVRLIDALNFAGTAPFAIELWVSEASATAYQHFFTRETRNGTVPQDGYALVQDVIAGMGTGVYLERVTAGSQLNTAPAPIAANRFTYLVAQYDGTALEMFVDGTSVSRVADTRSLTTFSVVALIGANPVNAFYSGVMDEVAVYDHVLAPERIALHRAIAVTGPR